MLIELIPAISDRLHEVFGPQIPIYVNEAVRDAGKDCFLIALRNPDGGAQRKRRMRRGNAVEILYFPADGREGKGMPAMAERLMEGLSHLTLWDGTLICGNKRRYALLDGTLHFFIEYNKIGKRSLPMRRRSHQDNSLFMS